MELKEKVENEVDEEIKQKIVYMNLKYKMTPTALMYKFNISLNQIRNILYNSKYRKYRADYNSRIGNGIMLDSKAKPMFTEEEIIKMIELRNNGATFQKIASLYKCTPTTARDYILRYKNMNNVYLKTETFTSEEIAEMYRLRLIKLTYVDIAEYFKTEPSIVRYYVMKHIKKKNIDVNKVVSDKRYTEKQVEEMNELRKKGLSYAKIAKILGGNASTIILYLKEYNKNKLQ